jgi:hypothetical protein
MLLLCQWVLHLNQRWQKSTKQSESYIVVKTLEITGALVMTSTFHVHEDEKWFFTLRLGVAFGEESPNWLAQNKDYMVKVMFYVPWRDQGLMRMAIVTSMVRLECGHSYSILAPREQVNTDVLGHWL